MAEGLHGARARGTRDVIRLRVSIARLRLRISFMRLADEEKKKKHSYEYFLLDEFDWLNCVEAVQECFCVCDNYAVFCEIFDECF